MKEVVLEKLLHGSKILENLPYHLHVQMQKLLIISGHTGKSLIMCIFSLEVIYWLKDAILRNPLEINKN
jgi:hypothetical protein